MEEYFIKLENDINNLLKSDKIENIKDNIVINFISIIDFIFYDTELYDVKFKNLTNETQEKIIEIAKRMDNSIMKYSPNYKENFKDNYKNFTSYLSNIANKTGNKIEEKIGSENYNNFKNSTNDLKEATKNTASVIGDTATTIYDKSKEKANNWYNNLKDKYKKEN